eukprot:15262-Heterococcus_DN1.PRE.2
MHVIQHYPLGGIAFADTHLHKHSATVQQATTATATATATLPGSIELVDMKDSHHDGSSSPRLHATPAAKLFDSKVLTALDVTVITDETQARKHESSSADKDASTPRPDAAQALRDKIQAVADISKAVAQSAHVSIL